MIKVNQQLAAGILTLLCTVSGLAQQPKVDAVLSVIDRDSDGTLSASELKAAPASIRMLDINEDGVVALDEVQGRDQRGTGGSRLGGYEIPPPANNVPEHDYNMIVGRLTDHSVTVRVLLRINTKASITYGTVSGEHTDVIQAQSVTRGKPIDFVLDGLLPNTRYYYQLHYESRGREQQSAVCTFHTQRDEASPFVFTVQADSHLDENTSGEVYLRTLGNALADQPDFHFALGDTFMTGKYVKPELSEPQYLAQRYYLGQLCHSAALYFALGNHDGEAGNRGSNVWATMTRKRFIPNPFPDEFFTGNENREPEIGLPENYYQFEWGDAQFIVLDPFRHTTTRSRGGDSDNWY
ncbi:MAG: metallophosphoesterase, partial [Planctomycetales bacterium]|nr:metallophosphoesterase [Planctomycetales bacterium]